MIYEVIRPLECVKYCEEYPLGVTIRFCPGDKIEVLQEIPVYDWKDEEVEDVVDLECPTCKLGGVTNGSLCLLK